MMKTWNIWTWTGCLVLPSQPGCVALVPQPIDRRKKSTTWKAPIAAGTNDMDVGLEVGFDGIKNPTLQLNDPYPFSRN